MRIPHPSSLLALLAVAILGTGCDEPTGLGPGEIIVHVDEQGSDVPQNGYLSVVDSGSTRPVHAPRLQTTFTNIHPGPHTVRLDGLPTNCMIAGQNPVTVQVRTGQTAIAYFVVSCVPRTGTVRVTAATTGADPDPSGYLTVVDGVPHTAVAANATVAVTNVRAGARSIWLGDVAPNCTVAPITATVNVPFQDTAAVLFNVECVRSGALRVTVTTTGEDIDPDGYSVDVHARTVPFADSRDITPNGSVTFEGLRPSNDYAVTLHELTENCIPLVADFPTVVVGAGSTTTVALEVACSPAARIAIVKDGDIFSVASNGASFMRLTSDPALESDPAWSSTDHIAFATARHDGDVELYVMHEDGTSPVRLTTSAGPDDTPSWSPDGRRIAFRSSRDLNFEIYVINTDGTGLRRLTINAAGDHQPAWSSTGKIAFVSSRDHPAGEIYVMNDDGSKVVRLTNNSTEERNPTWSPDGSMIAFARGADCYYYYYECGWDLFLMNADGSNERHLQTGTGLRRYSTDPSWSPAGHAIAFTFVNCSYYSCDPPSVWTIDLRTNGVTRVTDGTDPVWKP